MKPNTTPIFISTIGFKCSYDADYDFGFVLSENRFKK